MSVLPAVARRAGPAGGDVPGRCGGRGRGCGCRCGCKYRCEGGYKCGAGGWDRDGDRDGDVDGWEARRRGDGDGLMPLACARTAGEVALGVVHFRVVICAWVLCLLLRIQKTSSVQ